MGWRGLTGEEREKREEREERRGTIEESREWVIYAT